MDEVRAFVKDSGVVMRHLKRAIGIAVLPTIHLCLCAYVAASEDVWNWIELSVIDFPLLYVGILLDKHIGDRFLWLLIGPWGLTIFGTMWWLCVGAALSYFFAWFVRICVARAQREDKDS